MQSSVVFLCAGICILSSHASILDYYGYSDTLQLVHVIFRHGDRSPEEPYANATSFPVGFGELTNEGKATAYKIGVAVRKRYGSFLTDINNGGYNPSGPVIEPSSSPCSRCRASIPFVLAGLSSSKDTQNFNSDLGWLRTSYANPPQTLDKLFWAASNCPNFVNNHIGYLQTYYKSPDYAENLEVLNYLAQYSGLGYEATDPQIALKLYFRLKSEQRVGYPVQPWAQNVWPEPITSLAAQAWKLVNGARNSTSLLGGFLLSKIVDDTYSTPQSYYPPYENRKIFLYSGNDLTVAAVLDWFGVFESQTPPYGAYILIEIHNLQGIRLLKIFYQNYATTKPVFIRIPNCSYPCTLDQFVSFYEPYFRALLLCK